MAKHYGTRVREEANNSELGRSEQTSCSAMERLYAQITQNSRKPYITTGVCLYTACWCPIYPTLHLLSRRILAQIAESWGPQGHLNPAGTNVARFLWTSKQAPTELLPQYQYTHLR